MKIKLLKKLTDVQIKTVEFSKFLPKDFLKSNIALIIH
jgi:hypothetical protein